MKFVDDARKAWKWFSIQIAFVGGCVQGAAWAFKDFRDWLGDDLTHLAGAAMFLGAIFGRLIDQKKSDAP
jgi:hypothetical protein